MVSLLLIISFLLHIVLLIAIYFLYQQLEIVKRNKNDKLEATLQSFLDEIKDENVRLQQLQQVDSTPENHHQSKPFNVTSEREEVRKLKNRENIYQSESPPIVMTEKEDKL